MRNVDMQAGKDQKCKTNNAHIVKHNTVSFLSLLKKYVNVKKTVSSIGTYMKRPAPGLNNMPKIPSKKSPPPLAKPRANILKSDDTSEFKSAFSNRIVSIVLLNPYPTTNGSVKEINFRNLLCAVSGIHFGN